MWSWMCEIAQANECSFGLLKRSYLVISFKKNIFRDTTKAPLQLLAPSNNNRGTAVCPLVWVNVVFRVDSSTSPAVTASGSAKSCSTHRWVSPTSVGWQPLITKRCVTVLVCLILLQSTWSGGGWRCQQGKQSSRQQWWPTFPYSERNYFGAWNTKPL